MIAGNAGRIDIRLEQIANGRQRIRHRDTMGLGRKGHMPDICGQRPETGLVGLNLAGQRHAHEGSPVETARKGNDGLATGMGAGNLDGILDGFCTGGCEQ